MCSFLSCKYSRVLVTEIIVELGNLKITAQGLVKSESNVLATFFKQLTADVYAIKTVT